MSDPRHKFCACGHLRWWHDYGGELGPCSAIADYGPCVCRQYVEQPLTPEERALVAAVLATRTFDFVIDVVTAMRRLRAEYRIPADTWLTAYLVLPGERQR